MRHTLSLLALMFSMVAVAQQPQPKIELSTGGNTKQKSSITVTGTVVLPDGFRLSNTIVTVRHQKMGTNVTYNTVPPLDASMTFKSVAALKPGTYTVWAVIDARGPDNRERNVSSTPITMTVE